MTLLTYFLYALTDHIKVLQKLFYSKKAIKAFAPPCHKVISYQFYLFFHIPTYTELIGVAVSLLVFRSRFNLEPTALEFPPQYR